MRSIRPSGIPFQDMCTMVGLMTLTWAWAETMLAATIGVIKQSAGPIKGHPEAPLSLKQRVACLRAALREIDAIKTLQQEGNGLADSFLQLGRRRHDFVHGAAVQLHEGGFGATLIAVERGDYVLKHHRFDESDANSLNAEIAKLGDEIGSFMMKICAAFE